MHELENRIQGIESRLDVVLNALFHVLLLEYHIMDMLDDLTAKVENNGSVIDSAIVLLRGLKSKLDACGTDPVKLAALSASLGQKTTALADAVVANTPVGTTPPGTPPGSPPSANTPGSVIPKG